MPAAKATDLIDVVDGENRVVGTSPRGSVLAAGSSFRTVHVLVVDEGGRVLLRELARTRTRHPGLWGSSVAAYLHHEETYAEGASRRLGEELGLELPLADQGVVRMQDERSSKFVGLFLGAYDSSPIRVDRRAFAAVRWWDVPELESSVHDDPSAFTPTFRAVFSRWRLGTGS